MFERFTDRARRVVVQAQDEARRLGHDYIGTEHLLLGVVHDEEGLAAKALESLGIPLESVRTQVGRSVTPGGKPATGHIPFTPGAKKSLELSLRESLQLGHDHIGTEHLLLGLLHEGKGVAAQVLTGLGADLDRARAQVAQLVHGRVVRERAFLPPPPGGSLTSRLDGVVGRLDAVVGRLDAVSGRLDNLSERLDGFSDRLAAIESAFGGKGPASPNGEDELHP